MRYGWNYRPVVIGLLIVLVLAGIGTGIGFAVYSAVTAPTKGVILDKDYQPGYMYWHPGYDDEDCAGSGKYRSCEEFYHPGYYQYIPPSWSFDLRDCPKRNNPRNCNTGWRDVDEGTYDRYTIGEYFPG